MGQFKDRIKANDGHVGSIPWTAPEVLAEQPDVDYASADCYSFGVVLFEIASRRDPYEHLSYAPLARACPIGRGSSPLVLTPNVRAGRPRSRWAFCGTTSGRRPTPTPR